MGRGQRIVAAVVVVYSVKHGICEVAFGDFSIAERRAHHEGIVANAHYVVVRFHYVVVTFQCGEWPCVDGERCRRCAVV